LRISLIFCQLFKKQIGIIAIASLKAPPRHHRRTILLNPFSTMGMVHGNQL